MRETGLPKTQSPANPATPQELACRGAQRQRRRVLAADDQPHILEAIELLLRPAGFEVDTAKSPAAVREVAGQRVLRRRAHRPELHARYHLGPGRSRPALRNRGHRQQPASDRHDRVGQRRTGRRSHAPRRARFHPEALGERAPARDPAHPGRTASRLAAHADNSKPKTGCCVPRAVRSSSPPRPPCSPCCRPSRASVRPMPTC